MKARWLCLFLAVAAPALAQITVNLCGLDISAGAGVNFSAAMAKGGVIYFDCGANPVIRISRTYTVATNTVLMGGVTLQAEPVPMPPAFLPLAAMFTIANGASLTLNKLTIEALFSQAYLVRSNSGHLIIDQCHVQNTLSGFFLGSGDVMVTKTQFSQVLATAVSARAVEFHDSTFANAGPGSNATAIDSTGGSVLITGSSFTGGGRVRCNTGTMKITNTQFTNLAAAGDLGGAVSLSGCQATVSGASFTGNSADGGGAIAALNTAASTLAISTTHFVSNVAGKSSGGAIQLATGPGVAHTLNLRYVDFKANTAPTGGAVDLGGSARGVTRIFVISGSTLTASVVNFAGNIATIGAGGALLGTDANVAVARGLFVDNKALQGGGAVSLTTHRDANVVFSNSLWARNTAAQGSAFYGNSGQFLYDTVAANQGSAMASPFGGAKLTFADSVIAGNNPNCDPALGVPLIDGGRNLQFPDTGCGAMPLADPKLDAMFIPAVGSPAYNAGDNGACATPAVNSVDLLGHRRPRGVACTLGAIEGEIESLVRGLPDPDHRIPRGDPDFSLTVDPPSQIVRPGESASFVVTVAPTNGFAGKIVYSLSVAPDGLNVTLAPLGGMNSSLTVTAPAGTDTGSTSIWTVAITATSGALQHTGSVTVTAGN